MKLQSTSVSHLKFLRRPSSISALMRCQSRSCAVKSFHIVIMWCSLCCFHRSNARLFLRYMPCHSLKDRRRTSPLIKAKTRPHFASSCSCSSRPGSHQGPSSHIHNTQFSQPCVMGARTILFRNRRLLDILLE